MELFNAADTFTVTATPGKVKKILKTLRHFLDYHKAQPVEEIENGYNFAVSTFMISSRNKPLHRFSHGVITVTRQPDDETEIAFKVRLSPLNIFGCIASVVAGLLLAFAFLTKPEISNWWALAAACAGPLFAYSAKDQSISRLKGALQEAVALGEKDWAQ